jgi:thiol-disulfide isomerase/thioredoxin
MKEILGPDDLSNSISISNNKPVLFMFSAQWCHACQLVTPFIEQLRDLYDRIEFFKIDVDSLEANDFLNDVSSIPTFRLVFREETIAESVGNDINSLENILRTVSQEIPSSY